MYTLPNQNKYQKSYHDKMTQFLWAKKALHHELYGRKSNELRIFEY